MVPYAPTPSGGRPVGRAIGRTARLAIVLAALPSLVAAGGARAAETAVGNRPLQIVPAGTPIDDAAAPRWNRTILLATPRLASGDTDALSPAIQKRVSWFTLAVLATVSRGAGPDGVRHTLGELGAGYAVPIDGRLTVIAADDPPAGAGIDFIGRQILAQNGRSLAGLTCVGVTDTMQLFDAEAVLHRDGVHRDFLMRHFIWVEPDSGQCSTCVWALAKEPDGGLRVIDEPIRWVSPGTREDRVIHVDAGEFMLGVPTKRAFGLVDLPPGRDLPWSQGLRAVAAAATYPPEAVEALAVELDRQLQSLRLPQQAAH
jgi:hypothetical protein